MWRDMGLIAFGMLLGALLASFAHVAWLRLSRRGRAIAASFPPEAPVDNDSLGARIGAYALIVLVLLGFVSIGIEIVAGVMSWLRS